METNDFAKGALIGAVAGAALGLLLAPKPGSQTRHELKEWGKRLAEKGKELKDRAKERYADDIDRFMEEYDKMNLSKEQRDAIKEELQDTFIRIRDIVKE